MAMTSLACIASCLHRTQRFVTFSTMFGSRWRAKVIKLILPPTTVYQLGDKLPVQQMLSVLCEVRDEADASCSSSSSH